ncbi:MAG: hypothetical protein GX786_04650, partial [Clostridiales bacterium]|nr:hypothetical protein [Clostridiales bacterium]
LESEEKLIWDFLLSKGKQEQTIYTAVNQRISNGMGEAREGAKAHLGGDLKEYEKNVELIKKKGFSEDFAVSMVAYQEGKIKKGEKIAVEGAVKLGQEDEEGYEEAVSAIASEGFDREEAVKLIESKAKDIKNGIIEAPEEAQWEEKQKGRYDYNDLSMSVELGSKADVVRIIEDMRRVGKSDQSIKSGISGKIKPLYIEALDARDQVSLQRIKDGISATGLYGQEDGEIEEVLLGWGGDYYYGALYEQIDAGDVEGGRKTRDRIKELLGSDPDSIKKMQSRIKNKYRKELLTPEQIQVLLLFGFSMAEINKWNK